MTIQEHHRMSGRVCGIANRLATKGQDRRGAFVRAWQVVKAGAVELPVKGTSYGSRQEALRRRHILGQYRGHLRRHGNRVSVRYGYRLFANILLVHFAKFEKTAHLLFPLGSFTPWNFIILDVQFVMAFFGVRFGVTNLNLS